MKPFTAIVRYSPGPRFGSMLATLMHSDLVERVLVHSDSPVELSAPGCRLLVTGPFTSSATIDVILDEVSTEYLLLAVSPQLIAIEPEALSKMLATARSTKAGLVYTDFYNESGTGRIIHPLTDYQPGSVRDDFDFGALLLLSMASIRHAAATHGRIADVACAGLYDMRLKLSIDYALCHLREPLYSVRQLASPSSEGEGLFAYVDPRNEAVQKEMERAFTDYLQKIGAYLAPDQFRELEPSTTPFAVEASVVIPVRNRRRTVAEAVKSALSQETDFDFNVIVADNHSTDGTTTVLEELSREYRRLQHIIPSRRDLAIGGCWNEALRSSACGRYAVQLDSDDLYSSAHTLQRIVDVFREGNYAMVIGSYTLVDENLEEIPPGLVDHREWSDENGRNNALRINGLGAPRAFSTAFMRSVGFLNVSYGEDYAAALRVCREYRIGRIYDNLYLCRRWSGNTDAALTIEQANKNNAFKDEIRSREIAERQKINREALRPKARGSRKT